MVGGGSKKVDGRYVAGECWGHVRKVLTFDAKKCGEVSRIRSMKMKS